MATLSEGSTASIVVYEGTGVMGLIEGPWVEKRYAKGIGQTHRTQERDRHASVNYLLSECRLKAPALAYTRTAYVMERVDTSRPLWEQEVSDEHIDILAEGLTALLWEGYEMRDVEVYVQPDGSLRMLDFGQVTNRPYPLHAATIVLSGTIVPASEVERLETAWATKLWPPVAQKDPCYFGCCCTCCMKCSREKCIGRCGTVRKVKTLQELYRLKDSDIALGKCTRQEWSDRNSLHMQVDRHLRWHHHTWYSGSHKMPDGTYAYLYLTGGGSEGEKPVYQSQAWKDWVTTYRAEFWRGHFYGSEYQPLCVKDCDFRLPHCACGELFHGMKLVEGKLVPQADTETKVDTETSCVVCAKPAEDGLPYCSLQCESHAKYEEDVEWQEALAAKKKAEIPVPTAVVDDDDEDEIEQLSRLAPKKQDYMTVEEFRRIFR
jgi:hypothetical protein